MHEFTCQRCGIHVIDITGIPHPEKLYCLGCRFIESLDREEDRREAARVLDRETTEEAEDQP